LKTQSEECKPETKPEWLHPAATWVMKYPSNDVTPLGTKALLTTSPWPSCPELPLPHENTFPATNYHHHHH